MKQEELVKGLAYLGTAYNKTYTQIECEQHYDFLQEYSYTTFIKAIKNLIRSTKFLPKINELVDECEKCKEQSKFEVIEFMNSQGYFKAEIEYTKAIQFLERGLVPEWLQNDINRYYKMMQSTKLNYQEQKLIG